ncbi:MAG: alpha-ketoglutarate-dependent dioxygenase AlkB [Bacteroidota bacterium]
MKLPLNCAVDYRSDFLSEAEATALYASLINEYHLDRARLIKEAGGKLIKTDSFKILFLTEALLAQNSHPEVVHGKRYPFSGKMQELKTKVERLVATTFDLAMCLYYPDGHYFAPYHRDQETSGDKTIIPSISLGEVRTFSFKSNTNGDCYQLDLAHGSALIMGDYCQSRYTHSLLQDPKYQGGRINITFRDRKFQ